MNVYGSTNPHATQISVDHSMSTDDLGVPVLVNLSLEGNERQGDMLGTQIIVQFFTGGDKADGRPGFEHYIALLDFEDWGGERCPRYAVYRHVGVRVNVYELCQDVAPELRWPGYDAEGRSTARNTVHPPEAWD